MTFYDEAKPLYSCFHYRDNFYKVVKFKRSAFDEVSHIKDTPSENEKIGDRFLASLSRSRSAVLQYALSNDWDYFFTGTIDKSKHDRFDIASFLSRLSQFIRDKRKQYGTDLRYLFVPERHYDGAWHIHGLIAGLPDGCLSNFIRGVHPDRLVDGDYLNWDDYSNKFGFCSLGFVRDPVKVAFYMTKYITKDLAENVRGIGKHMYICSKGLRKAVKDGDIYFPNSFLDECVSRDFDFCSVGYVRIPWIDFVNHLDPDCGFIDKSAPVADPVDPMQFCQMVEYPDLEQLTFFDL